VDVTGVDVDTTTLVGAIGGSRSSSPRWPGATRRPSPRTRASPRSPTSCIGVEHILGIEDPDPSGDLVDTPEVEVPTTDPVPAPTDPVPPTVPAEGTDEGPHAPLGLGGGQ
jgi:hypothetical protein